MLLFLMGWDRMGRARIGCRFDDCRRLYDMSENAFGKWRLLGQASGLEKEGFGYWLHHEVFLGRWIGRLETNEYYPNAIQLNHPPPHCSYLLFQSRS